MHEELEIEFKNMLTKKEYDSLMDAFQLDEQMAVKQVNHYFETDGFQLKDQGAALRIREKKQKCVFTLKEPHEDGLLETHATVSKAVLQNCQNGHIHLPEAIKQKLLNLHIPIEQLKYRGELVTFRLEMEWYNCLLVLDHSLYGQTEDFELELEAPEHVHGKKVFHQLLTNYNISKRPTKNKIQRFFEEI
ncbi:Uncharacterized protein YjbK [Salinibacillus kushneri]|uniref:Uncharacterized protein YjbK n=1 Tax=Salinibacillus kushneri TaxID=237682 RepID=A0A1I0IZF1_9BACI|nr:CYTH domain-containing protein [Salinibacillus kushneri]SEU02855.1 Uncharacterized protein YjbK [Salinibacillus kushneri]